MLASTPCFVLVALAASLVACGGGGGGAVDTTLDGYPAAAIDPPTHALNVSSSSAPAVYAFGSLLVTASAPVPDATGQVPSGDDPNCPAHAQSGDTTTLTGGCTDTMGRTWSGTLTIVGSATASARTFTASAWGSDGTQACNGTNVPTHTHVTGTYSTTGNGTNNIAFHVALQSQGTSVDTTSCVATEGTSAIHYDGTLVLSGVDADMNGQLDTVTCNGSGRLGSSSAGVVSASTNNEVIDSTTCNTEALSGTTTLTSAGHTGVITYDGATDCSPMSTVQYAFDGAAPVTLMGVACAVGRTPGAGGRGALGVAALVLAGVVARRRRGRA